MLGLQFGWVNRAGARLPGVALGVLLAGPALAQDTPAPTAEPAAPSSEPPPKIQLTPKPMIDLATPPPPPPEAREYRQHAGFYARVNLGLGTLLKGTAEAGGTELDTGGLTLNYDLLIGGSPAPGFTLGGAVLGGVQLSGDWESESGVEVANGDLMTFVIGPFADGFPDPKSGLHFGGTVGLALASVDPGEGDGADGVGVGGAVWGGTSFWVAPEWSMGGLLRLDALRATDDDLTITSVGLSLMFSLLYN